MAEWGGFNSFFANNNAGQSFLKGMEQGQAKRKLAAQENALSQYAMNPNDPNAVNALAQINPEMAIKVRQQQAQAQAGKAEADTKLMARAAKAGKTPQEWDAIATQLSQNGYPEAAKLVGKFDPNLRQAIMVQGGESDDQQNELPSDVRSYQYRQSLPENERPGFDRFKTLQAPRVFGSAEYGFNEHNPSGLGGQPAVAGSASNVPRVSDAATYEAVPAGQQYITPDGTIRVKPGGQSSSTTGGFLDPLNPR